MRNLRKMFTSLHQVCFFVNRCMAFLSISSLETRWPPVSLFVYGCSYFLKPSNNALRRYEPRQITEKNIIHKKETSLTKGLTCSNMQISRILRGEPPRRITNNDAFLSVIYSNFNRTKLGLILIYFVLISCATRQVLTQIDPDDEFERAMSFFENRKYDNAAQAFERIIFYHPSSEYVDDAQYWLARTYFEKKEYGQVIIEFDYLIKNFSNSVFLEEAYLYRAKSSLLKAPSYDKDQTELIAAIGLLDGFLTIFPNSQYTNEVKELILGARNRLAKKEVENGKLYIKLNSPNAAHLYFDYVIETYPETSASSEAKYYTAKLYEEDGKTEKALTIYRELLEDDDWKEDAEKRIKEIEDRK